MTWRHWSISNLAQSTAPTLPQNEGVDLRLFAAGERRRWFRASGLLPVYRAFVGGIRFPDDPNHRFTTNIVAYKTARVAQGWDGKASLSVCLPTDLTLSASDIARDRAMIWRPLSNRTCN